MKRALILTATTLLRLSVVGCQREPVVKPNPGNNPVEDPSDTTSVVVDTTSTQEYQPCPLEIEVVPHHHCATYSVKPENEKLFYWMGTKDEQTMSQMNDDELFLSDVQYMEEVAESHGHSLSFYSPEEIFFRGTMDIEWSPVEAIPGANYVGYGYEIAMESSTMPATGHTIRR